MYAYHTFPVDICLLLSVCSLTLTVVRLGPSWSRCHHTHGRIWVLAFAWAYLWLEQHGKRCFHLFTLLAVRVTPSLLTFTLLL